MALELVIEDVSKTYPNGVEALRGVTLRIGTGMFGLLGPNGAGKSTLMRILATLQEPDRGRVTFDGVDVVAEKDALRRRLGYLPQEFGVYPRVPAETMLDHIAVLKGLGDPKARRATVESLLRQTNLWEARRKPLGTFSGGMKQRFGIAQALLGDPKLIIVDEPTAGLDPAERLRFHNLLAEIGENVVVLLSTHIVEDVSDLCRRMAILAGGRLLLVDEPARAVEALEGRVWRSVVARADLPRVESEHAVLSTRLAAGERVVHVLADERPDPGFTPVGADLEDVYFAALRGAGQRRAA